ncbi:energy transducer TonB [Lysobacter solisilvae (ex Woo and Kim 2020)]|uniref:Uncharacterized protein n=1 Tax=Agrilutibacter terrestris TaxID=2865112 RepID=A0A7H0FUS7_9GAMM|nr:hypothetical protein [Lysobacter terrestris]QNP39793.1 hypothetical protein H8B22_09755 [Lysobacter terrestris]
MHGYIAGLVLSAAAATVAAAEAVPARVDAAALGGYWIAAQPLQPALPPQAAMNELEGCYVAEFDIDPSGRARDARIAYSQAKVRRTSWFGMRPRDVARSKNETLKAQERAILDAVRAITYAPATGNAGRIPVRTRTVPIVVSMLSLADPGNAEAVLKAKAAHEARREALFDICLVQSK